MKLTTEQIVETIDLARGYLADRSVQGDPAAEFAAALVQIAGTCVVGVPCPRHYDSVHGQEAEELRSGIEQILASTTHTETRRALIGLLDDVDARDSLAFCEAKDVEDGCSP